MGLSPNMSKRGRYEVRSSSGTAWWHSRSLEDAFRILRESGAPGDYVYDSVTGARPRNPDAREKR